MNNQYPRKKHDTQLDLTDVDTMKLAREIGVKFTHFTNTNNPIDFSVNTPKLVHEHPTQLAHDEAAGAALYFLAGMIIFVLVAYGGFELGDYMIKLYLSTP